MIISASRRTDIPAYYSAWFYNRIREGFVLVRNPMRFHQISRINLSPDLVDGIVFWTKNPLPMLDRLNDLKDYMYYFQFTVTPYGKDVEPNLPLKADAIISSFKRLSEKIGADRIVWRYDPILINARYQLPYHIRAFNKIAAELHDYTRKVTFSFIDEDYRGIKSNIKELSLLNFPLAARAELSSRLAEIAASHGLEIDACAEPIELQQCGIKPARCIDDRLFAKLLGYPLRVNKDRTQRLKCGCAASVDIGMYNTCRNGCLYCYANYSRKAVEKNFTKHNPSSPLISGNAGTDDKISERVLKSCHETQLTLGNMSNVC
ncbi:MAG: DUF1848 domain-containing protein [Desulfarculales bacterium]|jgi:hypothetical protein|nr:DUF1848 domain-containing protein [Desulfarculales bacterium]